jgi:hypothetical protein
MLMDYLLSIKPGILKNVLIITVVTLIGSMAALWVYYGS